MRAPHLTALALTALLLLPAASQAQEILTELPSEDLIDLLDGLRFEEVSVQNETDSGTSIRVETGRFFFFVENYDSGYVRIVAWFDNEDGARRSTLALVNDWNLVHSFSKAYIDESGQYVLEADFTLDQDITEAGIEERVLEFIEHLDGFGDLINS